MSSKKGTKKLKKKILNVGKVRVYNPVTGAYFLAKKKENPSFRRKTIIGSWSDES